MRSRSIWVRILVAMFVIPLFACATRTPTIQFTSVPSASADSLALSNHGHSSLVTFEEFQTFDRAAIKIMSQEKTGAGTTGAMQLVLRMVASGRDYEVKTKKFPAGFDGLNNSPRKELAAFALQSLFLDPEDFVAPTTGVRCLTLSQWAQIQDDAPSQLPGTHCALVTFAHWLSGVTLPEPLHDKERFVVDGRYAMHLANFNILTYLVNHHDNRSGNFLVSKRDHDRRIFAIDNGTTFGAGLFNWFYPPSYAWRKIRVSALPKKAIDRLRKVRLRDVLRLNVVVQMEADDAGILRLETPGMSIDPSAGVNVRGTTIQLGLDAEEIEDVWERIQELLEEVDEGKLTLF